MLAHGRKIRENAGSTAKNTSSAQPWRHPFVPGLCNPPGAGLKAGSPLGSLWVPAASPRRTGCRNGVNDITSLAQSAVTAGCTGGCGTAPSAAGEQSGARASPRGEPPPPPPPLCPRPHPHPRPRPLPPRCGPRTRKRPSAAWWPHAPRSSARLPVPSSAAPARND